MQFSSVESVVKIHAEARIQAGFEEGFKGSVNIITFLVGFRFGRVTMRLLLLALTLSIITFTNSQCPGIYNKYSIQISKTSDGCSTVGLKVDGLD